jgi:diguanylate cyclase (GGDEF)-like protein/PAS domain S-box-containing protein
MADGPSVPAAGLRVLMLEDDPVDRELIEQELRRGLPSVHLEVAGDEATFLDALARGPDLVLVDFNLPGYGGLPALRAVLERSPRTPVIVVTGSLDEETAAEVIKSGAADYLLKDRLARLAPAITAALEKRRILEEKDAAMRALRESEERFSLAVRGANDGIWDWDLRSGRVYYSPRWRSMLGTPREVGDRPEDWLQRVHPEDLPLLRAALDAHLAGDLPHLEVEHRVRHADGTWRWMLARGLAVRGPGGDPYRLAGSQTDVTRRKEAEERLRHAALHDVLTGLPNRTLLLDRIAQAVGRGLRGRDFAVLYIDLDQFKLVNDSLGHVTGDELLRQLAGRFQDCMRPADTVARLGGDEFAAVVEDVSGAAAALQVADRVHQVLHAPFMVMGHELRLSASIGVVAQGRHYTRAHELLRDADTAMYRAKRMGRGGTQLFDASMHASAALRLRMESDLWQAVERDQLELEYQPIVDLAATRTVGMEALVRWRHPQHGWLLPQDFVPLAEETGAIVGIGRWVLGEACRTFAAWNGGIGRDVVPVSVNVSARQFAGDDILGLVHSALDESGLPANHLRLELTESAVMEDPEEAAHKLSALKRLGVGLAIDDFGTGYSSLSQLSRFPIDALKVDRSFVQRMSARPEEEQIVRTIVALADHLGVSTVAEGVETPRQRVRLQRLGCRFGQGFLFSRPLSEAAAADLMHRHLEGAAQTNA